MDDNRTFNESDAQNANEGLQKPAEAAQTYTEGVYRSENSEALNGSQTPQINYTLPDPEPEQDAHQEAETAQTAENAQAAQDKQPETVIVTPVRPQHSDTFTGARYGSAYSDPYGTRAQTGAQTGSSGNGSSRKHTAGTVALCLICGILGGCIFLGGNALLNKLSSNKSTVSESTDSTVLAATASPEATADSSAAVQNGDTVNVSVASAVPIEGSDSTAPAVAVAQKVLPSIVGIEVTTTTSSYWYGEQSSVSQGSGVIFTEDGYIITNHHVIADMLTSAGETNPSATLKVYLYTDPDNAIDGTLVGYDQSADLAVIKIDRTGLTAIDIGNSDELTVGEIAIALGNPGGLEFLGSVSQGIISGLDRSIQTEGSYENLTLIQTDAAINPGNSGGALVDVYGRLIGINSVKIVSDGFEGMGFAIPVNDVVSICTDIIKNGSQHITYLGVELNEEYSASYLERLGYPGGLLVGSVIADSPAAKAGIQEDDIIVSFDGTKVTTAEELAALKNAKNSGDTVTIQVYRLTSSRFGRWTGEYIDLTVTLG